MKEIVRLAFVLTTITVIAALLLSKVEEVTREPIAEQRRQLTLRALGAVLPPFDNAPDEDTATLVTGVDRRGQERVRTFYRGSRGGILSGVAFEVVAPDGYSGNIHIMVGVYPDGAVRAIQILTHAETPGLGDKIEDPPFKGQFAGKTLENNDWRVKKDGGEFDQITGATISARATVGAVRKGLLFYRENLEAILAEEEQVAEEEVEEEEVEEEEVEEEEAGEPEAVEEEIEDTFAEDEEESKAN
jgi:Na+-translocating ferredoxin:NAD+ oxidoreductase subunit G